MASILTIDDIEESTLIPIVCKFCERYATYIEFDFVIHLHEAHGIGRGYLYTSPTPYTQSRSWSDDFRIRDAIIEGKKLGSELDEDSIEKLDMAYSKRLGKTSSQVFPSIQETRVLATTHEAIGVGQISVTGYGHNNTLLRRLFQLTSSSETTMINPIPHYAIISLKNHLAIRPSARNLLEDIFYTIARSVSQSLLMILQSRILR